MDKITMIDLSREICRCNNCNELFYDTNPQVGAPKFEKSSLRSLIDNKCPNCNTDDYLIDITDVKQLTQDDNDI